MKLNLAPQQAQPQSEPSKCHMVGECNRNRMAPSHKEFLLLRHRRTDAGSQPSLHSGETRLTLPSSGHKHPQPMTGIYHRRMPMTHRLCIQHSHRLPSYRIEVLVAQVLGQVLGQEQGQALGVGLLLWLW